MAAELLSNIPEGVETFEFEGVPLAHVYRSRFIETTKGINFLTPNEYPFQVGVLNHPKDYVIKDHAHNPEIKYQIDTTQEFLYIVKGKVLVKLFSCELEEEPVAKIILEEGDAILLVGGGHGFEMLEGTIMFEVKQGPFYPEIELKVYRKEEGSS